MAMKENTKKVIKYLQGLNGADVTAADVAEALGLEKRQVDGVFTSAIQRKGLGFREPAQKQDENGMYQNVKFLKLNEEGYALDCDAQDAE